MGIAEGPDPRGEGAAVAERFAWRVLAFLFAASMLNYIDRAVLGVVMPQVRRDLGLTNTDYGLAVNAFLITYAVCYVWGGRLADRFGCRRAFSATVGLWSVANMLHALSQGLLSLSLFRALLGVGEGAFYPTAIRGVTEWFTTRDRAKAVGLILSSISVGTLLTPPLAAWISVRAGWRMAFVVTGAAGLLLLPGWWWLQRRIHAAYGETDPAPAARRAAAEAGLESSAASARDALAHPKYWIALLSRASTDAAWYFYLFWMPGYFQEVRGFTPAMVGQWLWIPFLTAGCGAVGGAWVSSELLRRGFSLDFSRKSVLFVSAALGSLGALAYWIPDPILAVAVISVTLFGHTSFASNIHTVITEISPPRHVAMLYGITGAAGTLLGAVVQPLIGRVVDLQGYGPAYAFAGISYWIAIVLLAGIGRIEPIRPRS